MEAPIQQATASGSGIIINYSILDDAIGYHLRRAQLAVFHDFSETFATLGLRPADFSVVLIIAHNPGLKQSEVAEALGIQRANFVAIIDGLEARCLAERRKSDTDRRVQALYLTEQGKAFYEDMIRIWGEHEARFIEKLGGEEERDILVKLLARLTA